MRIVSICLILVFGRLQAFSQVVNSSPCQIDSCAAGLGDVRYSILPPECFYKVNNHVQNEWVLMDGRPIINSKLFTLGITHIPDARGMFIRNMDMGRFEESKGTSGDPDWKTRNVVEPQKDMVGAHKHKTSFPYFHGSDNVEGGRNYPRVMLSPKDPSENSSDPNEPHDETRPRNIALYCYIKIN